jgi:hypothetical protein
MKEMPQASAEAFDPSFLQHLSMYEISGQGKLTKRHVEKYLQVKRREDARIHDYAEKETPPEPQPRERICPEECKWDEKIKDAPEDARADLIRQGLLHENPKVRIYCASHIRYLALADQERIGRELIPIIQRGLRSGDPKMQGASAVIIYAVSKDAEEELRKELVPIIQQGIKNSDLEVQRECVDMIMRAPEDARADLIREGFRNDNPYVRLYCSWQMKYVPADAEEELRKELVPIIQRGLESNDSKERRASAGMIASAPIDTRADFFHKCLKMDDVEMRKACAGWLYAAPEDEKEALYQELISLIKNGLESSSDLKAKKEYAGMIRHVPKSARTDLIRKGLESDELDLQKASVRLIEQAPAEMRAELFHVACGSGQPELLEECEHWIHSIPIDGRVLFIREGLESGNPNVQRAFIKMIRSVPPQERTDLLAFARSRLGDLLIESPLYQGNDEAGEFHRRPFSKTGSESTLLGGPLKDKLIIRHIKPSAFLVWQELYENAVLWKKAGFDYVPIEPIQSYRLNQKKGLVEVASGVLDLSLVDWNRLSDQFHHELIEDRDRIINVLQQEGIKHGHSHDANFCLRFFRGADEHVNFDKKPRIYLIDFDQAISPSPDVSSV